MERVSASVEHHSAVVRGARIVVRRARSSIAPPSGGAGDALTSWTRARSSRRLDGW